MSKKVLIPLAQGFEEAEFIGIADVLKRAKELNPEFGSCYSFVKQ